MHGAAGGLESDLAAVREALSPPRAGPRPRMTDMLPHTQLDQWPPVERTSELEKWAAGLQHVVLRQSRMASPDSAALALTDGHAGGPPEAFVDAPEFCLLHGPPEGGIHLTLPAEVAARATELGWGEPHPASRTGSVSPHLVALYAPRDDRETAVVLALMQVSWRFARGELLRGVGRPNI
jgi:hypothetical protein